MPTYEYLCKTCGHRFETWQKMTDEPLTECPECGQRIRRVLYPAGVVFKGSGFYKTDHREESKAAAASEHKSSESAAGSTSDGKVASESKPAANGEGKTNSTAPSDTKAPTTTSAA